MMNPAYQASGIASLGRYGDSTLMHMNPEEVNTLSQLGEVTINPYTGLPEAFSLSGLLKGLGSLGATIGGGMIGGPLGAGIASSLFSGVTDRNLKKALLSWSQGV